MPPLKHSTLKPSALPTEPLQAWGVTSGAVRGPIAGAGQSGQRVHSELCLREAGKACYFAQPVGAHPVLYPTISLLLCKKSSGFPADLRGWGTKSPPRL